MSQAQKVPFGEKLRQTGKIIRSEELSPWLATSSDTPALNKLNRIIDWKIGCTKALIGLEPYYLNGIDRSYPRGEMSPARAIGPSNWTNRNHSVRRTHVIVDRRCSAAFHHITDSKSKARVAIRCISSQVRHFGRAPVPAPNIEKHIGERE